MTKRIVCTVGADGRTMIRRRPRVKLKPPQKMDAIKAQLAKTLFGRVQLALDVPLERLAEIIGADYAEVIDLQGIPDGQLGGLDAALENTLAYVNERLGMCIALRSELEAKLYKSRREAMARRQLIRGNE